MTLNGQNLAKKIAIQAENKKGEDIVSLDLQGLSLITDYFVIVSGNNERHVQAIVREIKESLSREEISPLQVEGEKDANWVLMDYGDVVVHVFQKEAREYYQLEKLWADAPQLQILS